jgi:predicted amidohydrolase
MSETIEIPSPIHYSAYPRIIPIYPDNELHPLQYDIKIALIPMKIPQGYFEHVTKTTTYQTYEPVRIQRRFTPAVILDIREGIKKAIDNEAKIIILSEYSYPIFEDKTLRNELSEISARKKVCIIAGTFADTRSKKPPYNTSLLFTPWRVDPYPQYKTLPGKIAGHTESIKTNSPGEIYLFFTRFGTFAITICLDMADLNTMNNIIVWQNTHYFDQTIDMVFVPAYTDKENQFADQRLNLSKYANNCIFYVCDSSLLAHEKIDVSCLGTNLTTTCNTFSGPVHIFTFDLAKRRNSQRDLHYRRSFRNPS